MKYSNLSSKVDTNEFLEPIYNEESVKEAIRELEDLVDQNDNIRNCDMFPLIKEAFGDALVSGDEHGK